MCSVSNNRVGNYIDDLHAKILIYDLNKLYELYDNHKNGWFFCFYVKDDSNYEIFCENTTCNASEIDFKIAGSRKRKRNDSVKEYSLRSKYKRANKSQENRKYYEMHKDKVKENRKEHYEMHKDEVKNNRKGYYEKTLIE